MVPSARRDLEIVITPREYIGAQIVLPAGIVPSTASLAGRLVDGRWTATFIAVPESGLTVRLGFDSGATAAQAMTGGAVMLTSRGLPGGSGPLGQPDWLPQGAGDLAGAVDLDRAAEMTDSPSGATRAGDPRVSYRTNNLSDAAGQR